MSSMISTNILEECVAWKKEVMDGFKLVGILSSARYILVLLANQWKVRGKLNHCTLSGFFLTEIYSSKYNCAGNPWILSYFGERQLKIHLGSFHDVPNRLHKFCDLWPWNLSACTVSFLWGRDWRMLNCWSGERDLRYLANCIGWQILCPWQNGIHETSPVTKQSVNEWSFISFREAGESVNKTTLLSVSTLGSMSWC